MRGEFYVAEPLCPEAGCGGVVLGDLPGGLFLQLHDGWCGFGDKTGAWSAGVLRSRHRLW